MSKSLTTRRVKSLLRTAAKSRVLVIGDVMLDQFLWGHVKRISPEAPVPVLRIAEETEMLGGVGNVVRNLTGLGAKVRFATVVGNVYFVGPAKAFTKVIVSSVAELSANVTVPLKVFDALSKMML